MAHGRPWYKRAGGDFVMATIGMPDAETKWAYSAIIDMLNDRDRPLADEPGFICGFTGLTKRRWAVVRAYLIDQGYLTTTDAGEITNPRYERERAARQVEHERSVKAGREGGKRSAAKRAGQTELDLESELSPEKQAEESRENDPKVQSNVGENDVAAGENNDLGEGPPQPSRARKRLEARVEEKESTTANLGDSRGTVAVDAPKDPMDILGITNRLARLGGVPLIRHSALVSNLDLVKGWLAAGYDLETIIVPAIERQFEDTTEESIAHLNFYSGRIAKLFARQKAKPRPRSKTHQEPNLYPEGEDRTFTPFRQSLLRELGPEQYATLCNRITLTATTNGHDEPVVRISDPKPPGLTLNTPDRAAMVKRVAEQHGFTDVW